MWYTSVYPWVCDRTSFWQHFEDFQLCKLQVSINYFRSILLGCECMILCCSASNKCIWATRFLQSLKYIKKKIKLTFILLSSVKSYLSSFIKIFFLDLSLIKIIYSRINIYSGAITSNIVLWFCFLWCLVFKPKTLHVY